MVLRPEVGEDGRQRKGGATPGRAERGGYGRLGRSEEGNPGGQWQAGSTGRQAGKEMGKGERKIHTRAHASSLSRGRKKEGRG